MITGRSVICISSIDWDFIWQGHQEIMTTLARHGNRVLFIENTGVRPVRVGDLPRIRSRIRNWWRGTKGFREERPNLFIFSPVVLPFPYSRLARWLNRTTLLRALGRWMRAVGFHNPIVWTFLPTPLARDLMRELDPLLTIYYCIDDLASSSRGARKVARTEDAVFKDADLVFVTSEKLRERAARLNSRVHLFPFGVSFEVFERVRLGPDEAPADLRSLPRPVIGYIGGLHQWLDQSLVCAVADAMPDASIVLVGPTQTDVAALEQRPNVHMLGARAHAQLPSYIKGFDVGLVPYRLSEYTAHVYPTKLNEYLAMGVPVVATDLPEIRRFNARHGDIVAVGQDGRTFVDAVRRSMDAAGDVERRLDVARENSWTRRIEQMSGLIEDAITMRESGAVSWEVRLRRLYGGAVGPMLRTMLVAVAIYITVFHTPLLWIAARPLVETASPVRADAVVVFGGGVGESGSAGGGYQERVREAVELYDRDMADRIIFSSGFVWSFREAEIMKSVAVGRGVPQEAIELETRATTTYENVVFVRDLLRNRGARRILLVSSPYHMRRALLTWRKQAPDIDVIPAPVRNSRFYAHGIGSDWHQIRGIAHEYLAIAYYRQRGWL